MKKLILILALGALVFASSPAQAADRFTLGNWNFAVKADYFHFTDKVFDDSLNDGVYIGAEAYFMLPLPNLYLGVESGWAGSSNDGNVWYGGYSEHYDTDATYVPIELNLKYAIPLNNCGLSLDFGAGVSYNYFKLDFDTDHYGSAKFDDWVFGGQFFADLNYKIPNSNWFFAAEVKYQITNNLDIHYENYDLDTNVSADNLRAGLKAGLAF